MIQAAYDALDEPTQRKIGGLGSYNSVDYAYLRRPGETAMNPPKDSKLPKDGMMPSVRF